MQADPEFLIDTKYLPPKIPEGVYEGVFVRQEMAVVFKCPKIFVYFRITELGQHHGVELFRAYRVGRSKDLDTNAHQPSNSLIKVALRP